MEPHPNASLTFHHDVFQHAQQHYNMQMLFTDFLCYRGQHHPPRIDTRTTTSSFALRLCTAGDAIAV